MANLSPFQRGYGSLQIFSVFQNVPSGPRNEFLLTGLRRDGITALAPGIFREKPVDDTSEPTSVSPFSSQLIGGRRLPINSPSLVFSVIDQGDLDEQALPVNDSPKVITVAPEVVHLSRFANNYILYPEDDLTSRVDLCLENADVAESLKCFSLAHMWRMIAAMLDSAGTDSLPEVGSEPSNAMQFILLPTIKSILEERAEIGDVQTCVAVCEVLQVLTPDDITKIPGLEINIVREWYLSYIDLLRDMCLFSFATSLIRRCKDPFIGALNQQSTT
jgi:WD repeat-containing protein 24